MLTIQSYNKQNKSAENTNLEHYCKCGLYNYVIHHLLFVGGKVLVVNLPFPPSNIQKIHFINVHSLALHESIWKIFCIVI